MGSTLPFWGHPSTLGLWVREKNALFSPSPGINECRDFGWGYLSSAGRAGGLISRMGSNQQFVGDPFMLVTDAEL